MSSILREWRGVIRKTHRQEYVDYIKGTGLDDYRATPGNQGAAIAVRDLDQERTEVITLSWWDSLESIRAFAGDDIELARYYPLDDKYLLERPRTVQHYECHGDAAPGRKEA
jgi:heme-degrading monooxygenase HmoA